LEEEGWEVIKRGWPDFIAIRGNEVRFVEVKPPRSRGMGRHQRRVAEIFARLGAKVEVAYGSLDTTKKAQTQKPKVEAEKPRAILRKREWMMMCPFCEEVITLEPEWGEQRPDGTIVELAQCYQCGMPIQLD
jgi:hypothetical protein